MIWRTRRIAIRLLRPVKIEKWVRFIGKREVKANGARKQSSIDEPRGPTSMKLGQWLRLNPVIPSGGESLSAVEHMANPNRSRGTLLAQGPCMKCAGRFVYPRRVSLSARATSGISFRHLETLRRPSNVVPDQARSFDCDPADGSKVRDQVFAAVRSTSAPLRMTGWEKRSGFHGGTRSCASADDREIVPPNKTPRFAIRSG
jgi:hypothetical protein